MITTSQPSASISKFWTARGTAWRGSLIPLNRHRFDAESVRQLHDIEHSARPVRLRQCNSGAGQIVGQTASSRGGSPLHRALPLGHRFCADYCTMVVLEADPE